MYFSSHSSTAIVASGAWPSAEAMPASMLAPNAFEAMCSPSGASAAVTRRVVVVLPFVPVTRTTCRSCASMASSPGSSRSPMTPPITEPSPRPASRETLLAAPPTLVASLARKGSLFIPADVIVTRDGQSAASPGRH